MPLILSQEGNVLGALPADAVRVNSSLTMLTGKYVDSDGIIYDANGTVNEPATAAWAREIATRRVSAPYVVYDPLDIKRESVQEQSEADQTRWYWDAMLDNVTTTAGEIPDRVVDAATGAAKGAMNILQLLVIGAVAIAAIQMMNPERQGNAKRRIVTAGKRKVREYRKRAARYVAGD